MPRHPVPSHAAARTAADQIIEARTAHHAPDLEQLGDSLEDVVAHIARHGDPTPAQLRNLVEDLDDEVVRANVVDALFVLDYLDDLYARRLARWRLGVILAGMRAGMGPTALMAPLHQRHRQGVTDLVARLRAFLDPTIGIPDARVARQARTEAAERAAPPAGVASTDVQALAAALVDLGRTHQLPARLGEACTFDTDDLAYALDQDRGGDPSAGFLVMLRTIVRWLAAQPGQSDGLRSLLDRYAEPVRRLTARTAA